MTQSADATAHVCRRLVGRVALVTGAASGIGRATTQRLAAEGAAVVLADIDVEAGGEVAASLARQGGDAAFLELDVAEEPAWDACVARLERDFGRLDVLVNNAGMGDSGGSLEATTTDVYARTIAVTQTSVFFGMRSCLPLLRGSSHASVINVSSIAGSSGGLGTHPAYHAAKGAIRSLTKNAAVQLAAEGIRVNSVHPGFVDTPFLARAKGTPREQDILRVTPMGRMGRPEEIAAAIAFLASDDASFVTGSEVYADGGFMAV